MRIDDRNAATGGAAGKAADVASAQAVTLGKGAALHRSSLGTDSVELSGTSQSVGQFHSARSARLEQLAKAVQGGSYAVSSAAIGRALVGEAIAGRKDFATQ